MTHVPVMLTISAKYLVIFVSGIRHVPSTRRATSFTFANGFILCRALLMVGETSLTSKMPVTYVAGETIAGERARRARHTIATGLCTYVCYITPATFMTFFTFVSFSHCTCTVGNHVIISFDIVVE